MDIATRKEQIIRIQTQSPYPELQEALQEKLNAEVMGVTQRVIETALQEELQEHLNQIIGERPRRSGFFKRVLDSEYGRISDLSVPKLRHSNGHRDWQILHRYQRGLGSLLNFCLCLYVMGLSLSLTGDKAPLNYIGQNFARMVRQKIRSHNKAPQKTKCCPHHTKQPCVSISMKASI